MAGWDYHTRLRKQQNTAISLVGCFGCLGFLGWLGFWGLIIAALIKVVFFGGLA